MRIVVPADMIGLLQQIGLKRVYPRGDEVWASCPSHHDSGDSWSVNTRTGESNCFACGYAFDTLTELVMDVCDVDNFAANRLIRHYGLADTIDLEQLAEARDRPAPAPLSAQRSLDAAYAEFTDVPDEQLARRRLDRGAVDHFGVRWRQQRKAWILPIRSPAGQLLGWQEKGRALVLNRPPFPPGSPLEELPAVVKSDTLFGAEHLRPVDRLVLVESPLDVVHLHAMGVAAAASFGAGVSDNQMRLATAYADLIILALDNDEAGTENMARIISGYRFNRHGRMVRGTRWGSRCPIRVIAYGPDSPKDIGEMTYNQIATALEGSLHPLDWLRRQPRENRPDVQGRAKRVPEGSRRAHAAAGRHAGGLRDGARQGTAGERTGSDSIRVAPHRGSRSR